MEKEFDEDEAVAYMRQSVSGAEEYDDDQLLNLIDIIWDYYEDHGMLSISYEGEDPDAGVLAAHARKLLLKDKGNRIDPGLVEDLVKAEMEYEASLEET